MKSVLIVENATNSLKMNENVSRKDDYVLSGIFTEFNIKNRNDRIYTADKFLPALQEMNERINTMGIVYGEFDHPDVFDTSLSRASHRILQASYIKESERVDGSIKLLSTYWGKEARSLVDDGCPVFVSSRAAGVTEANGVVSLKKLFTYDIVADPGFASAKMDVKVLNESFGYSNNSNFRIYEMSNDNKINELFDMNKNDMVTKKQMTDYSRYLIQEIASTKNEVKKALKNGSVPTSKLESLLEYYEDLNEANTKMVKYLDYLADKIQVVVNENTKLKSTTDKLIKHNDYLAESIEKTITYTEYLAENLDKNIEYSEYIAENLDKNIEYSEYIAENLDKNIEYSEYIAENLDKNISYSEYLAESLDKNIEYSEYIAEHIDNTIQYSEYLAEHVEGNIAYSEYIAENLDDNIAYSEYVAESLDKSISYQEMVVEKLNQRKSRKLNENFGDDDSDDILPLPSEAGIESFNDPDGSEFVNNLDDEDVNWNDDDDDYTVDPFEEGEEGEFEDEPVSTYSDENLDDDECIGDECADDDDPIEQNMNTESELSKSIDKLIEEAKKRKVSESKDLHYLKFLNKSQVDSYYNLEPSEQEAIKLYISERSFYSQKDVLNLINEALSEKSETVEEKIIRLMPENIKPIWNQLNENSKKSIISQSKLYPQEVLMTESQIEHFWLTRNLKKNESITKKLVSHDAIIQEDKLSDSEFSAIMERFQKLK